MTFSTCDEHDNTCVVFSTSIACPLCKAERKIEDLEDQVDVLTDDNKGLSADLARREQEGVE